EAGTMLVMGRRNGWRARGATLDHARELWKIGVPVALQFMLEVGSFLLLVLLLSSLSELQMAAHQIAIQVCQLSFLPAYAVAEAAAVMAGQAIGARRQELVMRVAYLALGVASAYTALCSLSFAVGAHTIAAGFTGEATLAAVAVRLIYVAAVFQAF